MKVNTTQNSGNQAPVQSETKIKGITSNTLQIGEQTKTEKPFAKDSFEMGGLPSNRLGDPGDQMQFAESSKAKKPLTNSIETSPKGEANSLKTQDKVAFMDYTDDSCD